MSDGYRIKLAGTATGTGFKKFTVDPVAPTVGALLLIDPTHPADPIAAGLPAADAYLPNIVWEQARTMVGSGDRLSLGAQRKSSGTLTGAVGKLERSTKGGIHGIASQAAMVNGATERLEVADAIKTYLLSRPTNDLFISMWWKSTRDNLPVTGNRARVFSFSRNTGATATQVYRTMFMGSSLGQAAGGVDTYPDTSTGAAAFIARSQNTEVAGGQPGAGLGWRRQAMSTTDWVVGSGTLPTLAADVQARVGWGRSGQTIAGDTGSVYTLPQDQAPSFIFQRLYIEDLTISGRTHAQVDALDLAEHIKQVRTAGGRYFGDTFVTDPATIP